MKLNKKIQRMISKKLSFTNGWSIEEERYNELVKELATEIILTIEQEWNRKRHLSNSSSDKSESFNKGYEVNQK